MNKFDLCYYMSDDEYESCMEEMSSLLDLEAMDEEPPKYWEAFDPFGENHI